ncbi:MAG: hypothetical protein ACRDKH_04500 [Solirubrobacterales bacterium]
MRRSRPSRALRCSPHREADGERPNPGELTFSGNKVKVKVAGAGAAKAVKKLRNLKRKGKVKVKPVFSFTPTNGITSETPRKLKLRRKQPRR